MPKRPNGTWKSWANVESELRKLISDYNGILPGASAFKARGLSGLYATLQTEYGGLDAVRERLGVANLKFCPGCNQTLAKTEFRQKRHKRGNHADNVCRECSNARVERYRSTWWGKSAQLFRSAKERATKLNREFNLTREWVFNRLNDKNFCCEATGIPLTPDTRGSGVGFVNRFGASLDRIDSSRGYTTDNVRIVANRFNIALGDLPDDEFEKFAIGFLQQRGWKVEK